MNFKERFMSKLANSISELGDVAKLCSGREKKKKEFCSAFSCFGSQFDNKLE